MATDLYRVRLTFRPPGRAGDPAPAQRKITLGPKGQEAVPFVVAKDRFAVAQEIIQEITAETAPTHTGDTAFSGYLDLEQLVVDATPDAPTVRAVKA